MSLASKFDSWLNSDSVAALVIRQPLVPVEGPDGVIFPSTYASGDNFAGGYNIDPPEGDKNICLVDSVGSQANRIEPIFAKPEYKGLVPQVTVKAGEKSVSILEAGHRAADALVRCTALQKDLEAAFKSILKGDAEPLAKVAPTSIVFGVWDSRNTQAKLPRLVSSTIRAFDVKRLRRSAQFNPATEYVAENLLDEPADSATKDSYSQRGFIHVPATGSHGGVIATGGIKRDAVLNLAAIRLLSASQDPTKSLTLRRYILGLSLVAFTANASTFLRQGCNLVPDLDHPGDLTLVHTNGSRENFTITHCDAIAFAKDAAKEFKIGADLEVSFEKDLAKADLAGDGKGKDKPKAGKGKKASAEGAN